MMTNLNKPSMKLPELTITLTGSAEPLHIRPNIADMAKYDVIRARKGWPKRDDAEVLFLVGISYLAAKRTGAIENSHTIDAFIDAIDVFEVESDDDTEDDEFPDVADGDGLL